MGRKDESQRADLSPKTVANHLTLLETMLRLAVPAPLRPLPIRRAEMVPTRLAAGDR